MESGPPAFTDFEKVIESYYSQLCDIRPATRTDYPYETLIEHVKCCYLIFVQWIMSVLYNVHVRAPVAICKDHWQSAIPHPQGM